MKRFFLTLYFCAAFTLFGLFLCAPDTVQRSTYESVLFCAAVIIPSLFPGFVLSDLLIRLFPQQKQTNNGIFSIIFRLPSVCLRCWLIGILAGFPAATDCACFLLRRGVITKKEAERCLAFTNNPGIVFVICAVGSGLFGRISIGIYLWIIQTIAAILVGIMMACPADVNATQRSASSYPINLRESFPRAVTTSVSSVLNICGFIVFFRVLITVLTSAIPLNGFKILLSGLLEMTCGISCFQEFDLISAILCSVMLGWSGFSVHFQILNVTQREDLSLKYYFPGKVFQVIFSSVLTFATFPLLFGESNVMIQYSLPLLFCFAIFVFLFRFRKESRYGKNLSRRKTAS